MQSKKTLSRSHPWLNLLKGFTWLQGNPNGNLFRGLQCQAQHGPRHVLLPSAQTLCVHRSLPFLTSREQRYLLRLFPSHQIPSVGDAGPITFTLVHSRSFSTSSTHWLGPEELTAILWAMSEPRSYIELHAAKPSLASVISFL